MRKLWKYALLMACVCCAGSLYAQDPAALPGTETGGLTPDSLRPFVIRNIIIKGNKKTKPYIIERELPFRRGDSVNLAGLVGRFERARELLMNTTLFNEAIVAVDRFSGYDLDVIISVKERWYIFPIPYLKPVDRNLSEWAKQGYGFNRVNYGFKLNYNNFTGRNDKLKLWLITGYTRQAQFQYELPYIDRALKYGTRVGFTYMSNKEVNYATSGNEQLFYSDSSRNTALSKQMSGFVDVTYRPGIFTRNTLRIAFIHQEVDTAVINRNPKYFDVTTNKLSFPEISYKLEYTNVDYIPYPQKGVSGEVSILKRGFNKDFNMWQLSMKGNKHSMLSNRTSYSVQASGVLRLPLDQPFINQRLFGYGDFYLRGLEKYVIDGVGGMLVKNTLRHKILQFNVATPFRSETHDKIPFQIFLKTYFDAGYAYNKYVHDNTLGNRMLYTGGFGVDVVTFYDLALRFEYSFNQLGQSGFFFHLKNDF
ncbi:MAG TPA: POTRA domain-containing protein [Chitinophagaceae bacterium]|nr:POTRA domain-containing protein [Chitinophagaceae bacterium]